MQSYRTTRLRFKLSVKPLQVISCNFQGRVEAKSVLIATLCSFNIFYKMVDHPYDVRKLINTCKLHYEIIHLPKFAW